MAEPQFYNSPRAYIQSSSDVADKICRLDSLITALEDAAIAAAGGSDVQEYSLDDGQTKIREVYRSFSELEAGITAFIRLKNYYVNKYNGRITQLKDQNSLRGTGYYNC